MASNAGIFTVILPFYIFIFSALHAISAFWFEKWTVIECSSYQDALLLLAGRLLEIVLVAVFVIFIIYITAIRSNTKILFGINAYWIILNIYLFYRGDLMMIDLIELNTFGLLAFGTAFTQFTSFPHVFDLYFCEIMLYMIKFMAYLVWSVGFSTLGIGKIACSDVMTMIELGMAGILHFVFWNAFRAAYENGRLQRD